MLERAGAAEPDAVSDGDRAILVRRSGGYLLAVDPAQVDVLRARRLVEQARSPRCEDHQQVALLREAVALWRGEPMAGLAGPWVARTRLSWRQQHVDTVVSWADAELRAGPATVIGPLIELAGEHPLAESLTAVLMRVLHASGRTSDALDLYTGTRARLVDDLGIDPGPELQAVHQQVLRGQLGHPAAAPSQRRTEPGPPRQAVVAPSRAPAVPRQLPPAVPHFAGRSAELSALTDLLRHRADGGGTVVISAIGGTAGVGKTALAVHWAHQVADRFPDGQLYVNLQGFGPTAQVLDPADAVRGFLDALQVMAQRIPVGLDARTALYRSLTAGRRMLIVLDNARDTAQVRPLLPGSPTCLVVVTSRDQLTGLVAVLQLYREAGDTGGQAHTFHNRAFVWGQQGRNAEALDDARQAPELHRAARHRQGQTRALNEIGWLLAQLGDHEQALACCRRSLALHQDIDDCQGRAATFDSLAYAHHHLGHHGEAVTCYQLAIDLYRDLDDAYNVASALVRLGETQHSAGDADAARAALEQAVTIMDELDQPDAGGVRARLAALSVEADPRRPG